MSGAAVRIGKLRVQINPKERQEIVDTSRRAEKQLAIAKKKAKKELQNREIQARKEEKERMKRLQQDDIPDLLDRMPACQPGMDSTDLKKYKFTDQSYLDHKLQIQQLKAQQQEFSRVKDSDIEDKDEVDLTTHKLAIERESLPGNLLDSIP